MKQADGDFSNLLIENVFLTCIKLNYFYLLTFNFEVKMIEILKYILLFSVEKHRQSQRTNYQILGKYLSQKIVLPCAIEK